MFVCCLIYNIILWAWGQTSTKTTIPLVSRSAWDTIFTIALKNDKYVDSLLLCQYWKGTRMFGMEPQKRKVRSVCAPKANKGNMFVSGIEYRTPWIIIKYILLLYSENCGKVIRLFYVDDLEIDAYKRRTVKNTEKRKRPTTPSTTIVWHLVLYMYQQCRL